MPSEGFTTNQNAARGLSVYNVRVPIRPIMGSLINGFLDNGKVNRNIAIDFYKIYRGLTKNTLGGIIP